MTRERFVQVDDCRFYVKLLGENTSKPTVVMDAGYGDFSKAWDTVLGDISLHAKVMVYDRAGLGKSEKSSNPRISSEMVKELKKLLVEAKVNPPYILVGHSFGGVNMRMFATEYQHEVCGLVLIDSTPEDYRERFLPTMSKEFQKAYNDQFVYEGNYEEFMESLRELKETKRKLNVPLIVLSAGKKAHYSKKSQELWNKMQKDLLEISTNGELVIAKNSAHYIQKDEPKLIVSAIRKLIDIN